MNYSIFKQNLKGKYFQPRIIVLENNFFSFPLAEDGQWLLKKWLQSKDTVQDAANKIWPQSKDLKGATVNPFVKAMPHRTFQID